MLFAPVDTVRRRGVAVIYPKKESRSSGSGKGKKEGKGIASIQSTFDGCDHASDDGAARSADQCSESGAGKA